MDNMEIKKANIADLRIKLTTAEKERDNEKAEYSKVCADNNILVKDDAIRIERVRKRKKAYDVMRDKDIAETTAYEAWSDACEAIGLNPETEYYK